MLMTRILAAAALSLAASSIVTLTAEAAPASATEENVPNNDPHIFVFDDDDNNYLNYSRPGASRQEVCSAEDTENWYIYCSGRILEAVNFHKLYEDSKTFVDMPLRYDPAEVQARFDIKFGKQPYDKMNVTALVEFIGDNFEEPGNELDTCMPSDYRNDSIPDSLRQIEDPHFQSWAVNLYRIWADLCRKVDDRIRNHTNRFSLIAIDNEFIAPGGRFREFYYWDAYWIIKGLMASEMYDTAKQMIRNLAEMVNRFGFVPNGGRVYYLRRSQPPMLAGMVYEYYEATGKDVDFLHEMLPVLEKEIEFWDSRRRVTVRDLKNNQTYKPYVYVAASNVPRPEAYRADVESSKRMSPNQKLRYYQSIASGAESGWDFSTRWTRDGSKQISDLETIEVVPVDLNSLLCWNFKLLTTFYLNTQNYSRAIHYRGRFSEMLDIMEYFFYDDAEGAWFDYNLRRRKQNKAFFPSVAMPLFANCYEGADQMKPRRLYDYMKRMGVFDYPSGIPTSLTASGQQWDFPNGWSPLNHFVIEGLRKSESAVMQEEAYRIAKKWVYGNYEVFQQTKHMWEKYNVAGDSGAKGHGGEYEVQSGFGWSNGAILDLLVIYNDRLTYVPRNNKSTETDDADGDDSTPWPARHPVFIGLAVVAAIILFVGIVLYVKNKK